MTEVKTSRVSSAEAVANLWNEMGVSYLVLHGLEGYPEQIGRDLDILMDQDVAESALARAAGLLNERGWRCVRPPDLWGKRLVGLPGPGAARMDYLELHTMGHLRWAVLDLVDPNEPPSHRVGPFPASRWASFMKAIVSPILAGDLSRLDADYIDRHVESGLHPDQLRERCIEYFGGILGEVWFEGLSRRDPRLLIGASRDSRRRLLQMMAKRPVRSVGALPTFLKKKLGRQFMQPALSVVVETPPGEDWIELVRRVVDQLSVVFLEIDLVSDGKTDATPKTRRRMKGRQTLRIRHIATASGIRLYVWRRADSDQRYDDDRVAGDSALVTGVRDWILDSWVSRQI